MHIVLIQRVVNLRCAITHVFDVDEKGTRLRSRHRGLAPSRDMDIRLINIGLFLTMYGMISVGSNCFPRELDRDVPSVLLALNHSLLCCESGGCSGRALLPVLMIPEMRSGI